MPFGKGKKNGNDFSKLNRSTVGERRGNNKRSSFHLQVTSGMHFIMFTHLKVNWVAAQSQCFFKGVSCYRISGKSFKL
jgi:hypothetical protein